MLFHGVAPSNRMAGRGGVSWGATPGAGVYEQFIGGGDASQQTSRAAAAGASTNVQTILVHLENCAGNGRPQTGTGTVVKRDGQMANRGGVATGQCGGSDTSTALPPANVPDHFLVASNA